MTFLALSDWIWIGIDAFVALWLAGLTVREPIAPVGGPYALFAALMALNHVASLAVFGAPTVALGARAQDFFMATMLVAAGAFVDVAAKLAGDARGLPAQAWWFCGVGSAVMMTGVVHDPAFPGAVTANVPPTSILGTLIIGVALGYCTVATMRLVTASRREPMLASLVVALVAPILLSGWDIIAQWQDLPMGRLSGVVRSLFVVALARVLLHRLNEAERALATKTAELARSTERFREAQAALDRTEHLAAVGELSAVIAHEIKNPLAILANAATTLERGVGEPEAAQLVGVLDEEADRLNRLVDDVLVYARPLAPDTKDVELGAVLTHAARLALDGQPAARNIVIDWQNDGAEHWVSGDATLLRHALVNILDNAILAMPAGGTISVRLRPTEVRSESGIAVEFHDEGEGMDTQVRERATDPFFTTRESGTGLGLAIVDRVARAHGGAVTFASQGGAGGGTTVTFALPLRPRASALDIERSLARDSVAPFPIGPKATE